MDFVVPTTTRIKLSRNRWIEVKDFLSVGEMRKASRAIIGEGPKGERVARQSAGFAQTAAYLYDWNLTGPDGKTVVIASDAQREAGLDSLHKDSYDEIEVAVSQHIDLKVAEREEEKKRAEATS